MIFLGWIRFGTEFFIKEPCLPLAVGLLLPHFFFQLHPLSLTIVAYFCIGLIARQPHLFLSGLVLGYLGTPALPSFDLSPHLSSIKILLKQRILSSYEKSVPSFYLTFFLGYPPTIVLQKTFQGCGLSHLLAISGYHFQSLIGSFYYLVQLCSKKSIQTIALILISSTYFLLIDTTPSVFRSYVGVLMGLIASMSLKIHYPKNTLFLSLIVLFFLDSSQISTMGCLLSYLATFAILYAPQTSSNLLTNYPPLLRKIFSILHLNFYISLFTLPYILLKIEEFPPISLAINLFFPLLISPCMLLLILGLFFPIIAPLNQVYTQLLLDFLEHIPRPLLKNFSIAAEYRIFLEIFLVFFIVKTLIRSCLKSTNAV
jgi:ComEC/Rec2-related protein